MYVNFQNLLFKQTLYYFPNPLAWIYLENHMDRNVPIRTSFKIVHPFKEKSFRNWHYQIKMRYLDTVFDLFFETTV